MTTERLYADVHTGGDTLYLPLDEIEHRIALGQIGLDAHIDCPTITGDGAKPLWMIERFAKAGDTPEARMMSHFRKGKTPVVALSLLVVILCMGLLQQRGWLDVQMLGVGWSAISIHERWWTPWTYWVVHLDWMHWVGNGVLTYFCAQRVERMVGATSLLFYVVGIILASGFSVWALETGSVVGASTLVFGLWAMQVVLGFRFAHNLPPNVQSQYGWGNFLVFVPTLILNTLSADVSHVAHWTAMFIGGAFAVWSWPSTCQRPTEPTSQRYRHWAWLFVLQVVALIASIQCRITSVTQIGNALTTDAGFVLPVPTRLQSKTWCEQAVWQTDGLMLYSSGSWIQDSRESLSALSTERLHDCGVEQVTCTVGSTHSVQTINGLVLPSTAVWSTVECVGDAEFIERVLQRGELLLRVGCRVDGPQVKALCQDWLSQVQVTHATAELEAQQTWKDQDQVATKTLDYAQTLERYGRIVDADALLKTVEDRFDGYRWRGAQKRLELHRRHNIEWSDESQWLNDLANSLPVDEIAVLRQIVQVSIDRGNCEVAQRAWERWRSMMPTGLDDVGILVKQCRGD